MDALMEQFAIEARELVQSASDDLLALDREPAERSRLESVFRAIHTLKGSVGLFDFGPMHRVLHEAEEILSGARNGSVEMGPGFVDPLLSVVEWVERCVSHIEREGGISDPLSQEAKGLLAVLGGDLDAVKVDRTTAALGVVPPWAAELFSRFSDEVAKGAVTAFRYVPHPQCFFSGDDPLETVSRLPGLFHLTIAPRDPWPEPGAFEPYKCNLVMEGLAAVGKAELDPVFRLIPDQVTLIEFLARTDATMGPAERSTVAMRVDPARIDSIVSLAGELVTAKNGLLSLAADAMKVTGDDRLSRRILASHQEIERLVSELHAAATRARLVSLDRTFRRFPRMVRETAAGLGKSVEFLVDGGELEADREIVENLYEPLLHLVRNSLDHGIETADERTAAGKAGQGMISLLARKRGSQIEVEVVDDGRGLDASRIRQAAARNGLLPEHQAVLLPDVDALQLVFLPGFSTTASVSALSGRGVGLDAVKIAVERLGGSVELYSSAGAGASFKIRVPISFAMSRLLVVEVGGERYGIPLEVVVETVMLRREEVLPIRAGEAFILRDRTLPLLRLGELLGAPHEDAHGDLRILVCQVDGQRVGVAVDVISERTETLTRPLSVMLRGLPGIAGTTILGDGRILLVLDMEELVA